MSSICFHGEIVEFYTYRSARVPGAIILDFSQNWEDIYKHIKHYVERNGYRMDNHICWKTDDGLYCMLHDHKITIGTEILKGYW